MVTLFKMIDFVHNINKSKDISAQKLITHKTVLDLVCISTDTVQVSERCTVRSRKKNAVIPLITTALCQYAFAVP